MHIRVQSWDEVAKEQLAQYLYETRKAESILEESALMEPFYNYLEWVSERQDSVPIIAYADEEIVGWLAFFSFVPKIATIGRWHPIVKPGPLRDQIAVKLLKASIRHGKTKGYERLEAELTEITHQNEPRAQLYQSWLEAEGLDLATEEARLERKLTDNSLLPVQFPSAFELVQFQEYTNDELQPPFFEMFNNSIDRFWLDQTPAQRLDTFNFWFNRDRPVIDQATRVLAKDSEIVGITVVRPVQEAGMIGPIGVIPQYRRQGLGRGLLAFSMEGTLTAGFSKVQLEFDITNEPAFALYRSMGFYHVHGLRIFAKPL